MNRQNVFDYAKKKYGTDPDYPWSDNAAVLRHRDNGKWYGLVMEVRRDKLGLSGGGMVDVINVKCDPMLAASLRLQEGNTFGYPFLSQCYLEGIGTAPDYQQAHRLAWETKDKPRSLYVLGRIYCEGLGMPQDIAMGVEYLDRSGLSEAEEERKHYKKTLFGRWKRVN